MIGTSKLASIFILFGLSLFSGIISCVTVRCLVLKLGSSSKFKRAINILNCFSGGVFFATSVLNLLPEARESMEHALESYDFSSEYPFTELAMCIGFFMILTLEHIAHICCSGNSGISKRDNKGHQEIGSNVHKSVSGSTYKDGLVSYKKVSDRVYKGLGSEDPILVASDLEDSSYHDDITYQTYGTVDDSLDKTTVRPYSEHKRDSTAADMKEVIFRASDRILIKNANVSKETHNQSTRDALEEARHSANEDPARSRLRGLVLLIALSLHMIFDGLALGLLKDTSKVWELLAALSLHKVLVFFTIGVQTLEILASLRKTILVIAIFALMSPCGIIIGESINLSGESVAKDMSSAILQGVATGTFLFVTFFEILQRELGTGDHDLLKVFTTVVGFALVACIRLLEHEHGE
ncbi:zinc transporter ZIP3-like [Mercenaria mercenaria]|uniref:zinc transporter ZIP3-like n=1 Tax=Mercenaria mercenaria TaxID=6596 RepID=UPI00234F9602|nr:zinc transporter ZIP3-like [Mercenaria mercenaria]